MTSGGKSHLHDGWMYAGVGVMFTSKWHPRAHGNIVALQLRIMATCLLIDGHDIGWTPRDLPERESLVLLSICEVHAEQQQGGEMAVVDRLITSGRVKMTASKIVNDGDQHRAW